MKWITTLVCTFALALAVTGWGADGPRVEFFSPQGTVKKVRQVSVRFSDAIVPLGDPRALIEPFQITCPEKGTARWADGKNWVFDFDRDLPAGVRCKFALKRGTKTLDGTELTGDHTFGFSTGGPVILSSTPSEGTRYIDEEQIFILELDGEVSEASLLTHVFFSVEGVNERIGARIVTGEERKQALKARPRRKPAGPIVLMQAKQRFPAESKVKLVWEKGVASPSGVLVEEDQVLHFKTRPAFSVTFHCERENPQAACLPVTKMSLEFTSPVAWEIASRIVLKGPGTSIWNAARADYEYERDAPSVSLVIFKAPFPDQTGFIIELPAGLTDDAGRKPSNADKFPLAVRTDAFPPLAKFPAWFGILESKANPVLPVTVRNIEPEVKARLLKVGSEQGLVGKAVELFQKLTGRVQKVESGNPSDILNWLRTVDEAQYRYENDRGLSIFDSGSKGVRPRTFSVPKPNGPKAFEVIGIPLQDPGLYIVEIESGILGSALLENRQPMFASTAVLVTNLSVHLKWGRESSLAWVTTLDAAQPVKDAVVKVVDCAGSVLKEVRTDQQGIAQLGVLPKGQELPNCGNYRFSGGLLVTAESAGDISFVHSNWDDGIEPWRFRLPSASNRGPVTAHSILDRSLLRAGETVHMKHLLRRPSMKGFSLVPDENRPKAIAIQHLGTSRTYEFPLVWDTRGVAETTWAIPKEAKLGMYQIVLLKETNRQNSGAVAPQDGHGDGYEAQYLDGWTSGELRVEEFRVPLMKATVQGPSKPAVNAKTLRVDVSIQYLAGGGAGNLPVKLRTQVQPRALPGYEGFHEFVFANGVVKEGVGRQPGFSDEGDSEADYEGEGRRAEQPSEIHKKKARDPIHSIDLNLDLAGGARAMISDLPRTEVPKDLLAELEFRDPNGETQTASARIPLWPARHLVGLRPDSWAISQDALKFQVAVVNLSGKPVADAPVEVDLFERKTYSHRKRLVGGFYAYEHVEEIKRLGPACKGKTEKHGRLLCEVKPTVSGGVIIQAWTKDGAGNVSAAHHDVWVAGKGEWWFDVQDHDRMDVVPVRHRYEPGDKATFQVRMPFREATALITVEREGVVDTFVQHLSGKKPVVELPIVAQYAPNVFVSVLAVRGRVGEVQPTALVDLGRPAYKLGITQVNIGWMGHELKVKVSSDRPTYRVREKAVMKILVKTPDGKPAPPGSEVALAAVDEGLLELLPNKSWQLLETMMGQRGYEVRTATAQMHVVGKRHFGLKALPQGGGGGGKRARELFDTLLLWQGRVPLNEQGGATVEVPLNDSVTSFRIVAVATGGTGLFGTGSTSIRSTQDLMLFAGVAPLVREGDRIRSEFTIRNATDRHMEVMVAGRVTGSVKALSPMMVSLPPGEAKELGWDLTVPVGVDRLTYEIEAGEKAGRVDRLNVVQRVIPAVPVRVFQATLTQVEQVARLQVQRPADAIPGRGGVKIELGRSLADSLGGVTEYMQRYPYTCLEQKVSKAIVLGDPVLWKSIMDELPGYLDSDGLAKYFPSMPQGSDTLTAYILAIGAQAGWTIPDIARERMQDGLKKFITGRVQGFSPLPTADLSIRKLAAIEALSRYGQAQPEMLTSIPIEPNLWPTSAVLDWFMLLKRLEGISKREDRLKEAEQIIRSRLNFQGTMMAFSTEQSDTCWWLMVSGDLNAVRVILAFLDEPNWKEDLPRMVRGALGRQRRGAWDLTVANAWGALAIKKFSAVFEREPVAGRSTASLADKSQEVDWNAAQHGERRTFEWPGQMEQLAVTHTGSGKPWLTVQSLAAIPLREPFSSGYTIKRTVTPVSQKTPGIWSRGDVARVRLDLDAQSDMTWVVVSDPVPGGTTVLGGGLGRDSKMATQGEERKGWVWPAFEERSFEGFRAYYTYVPKGSFTAEYTVRLNQSGAFQLPPTRVEAMYSPEMFGERPNENLQVEP